MIAAARHYRAARYGDYADRIARRYAGPLYRFSYHHRKQSGAQTVGDDVLSRVTAERPAVGNHTCRHLLEHSRHGGKRHGLSQPRGAVAKRLFSGGARGILYQLPHKCRWRDAGCQRHIARPRKQSCNMRRCRTSKRKKDQAKWQISEISHRIGANGFATPAPPDLAPT